jgi:hypothetical protein
MVGTRVRDRMKEHTSAKITAFAIGTNRKPATPCRKNIGMNTMQMHSSDTRAGATICWAPSMIAGSTALPCSRCQLMFSMVTVASSTRMPTASARPPSVIRLSVSPVAASAMIEPRIDSGIETAMMTVERQLPRNSRIMTLVSAAAIAPSSATPLIAARTNTDWSLIGTTFSASGRPAFSVQLGAHAVDDRQRRGRAVLQHRHQHRAAAVDVHDIGLRRIAVVDVGDVAQIDGRAIHDLHRQPRQVLDRGRRVVQLDRVFEGVDLLAADRGQHVLRRQRVGDVLGRQAARLQGVRLDVDLDLALLAAVRQRDRRARHRHQRRAHGVQAEVEQLLLRQALPDSASCRIGTVAAL